MLDNGFRHIPIVEDERTVGIVSIRDVVRWTTEEPGLGSRSATV